MIVVVADDISGAAEIAGIACNRGLQAEVQTEFNASTPAELVSIDTDTRSCPADQAARRVAELTRRVLQSRPKWMFKKVDSMLRGRVLPELKSIMAVAKMRRALLAPANPSRGRVIREGHVFVDGRPVCQSQFASDPEYPADCSHVLDILAVGTNREVVTLRPGQELPTRGLAVVDANEPADLAHWASQLDETTLPAGAAEFFDAVLMARGDPSDRLDQVEQSKETKATYGRSGLTLFVCGSAAAWEGKRQQQCMARHIPIVPMPRRLFDIGLSRSLIHQWADSAVAALDTSGTVMIAIGPSRSGVCAPPQALVGRLAQAVEVVLQQRGVERLFIEGGASASALIRRMKWTRLTAIGPHFSGTAALQVVEQQRPLLFVKPGSYEWPVQVWPALRIEWVSTESSVARSVLGE